MTGDVSKPRRADPVTFNSAFIFGNNPSFVAQQREGFRFNPFRARVSRRRVEEDLPNPTPEVRDLAIALVQILKQFLRSDRAYGLSGEHAAIVASLSRQRKGLI